MDLPPSTGELEEIELGRRVQRHLEAEGLGFGPWGTPRREWINPERLSQIDALPTWDEVTSNRRLDSLA